MRVVFMGTPEYGLASLRALLEAGHEVAGVLTQPDKPKGRGGRMAQPPVKAFALERGIPVFQPASARREGAGILQRLKPEVCVTAAYGQILPEEMLAVPPLGTVNVHASLLPGYRGPAPVNWAIIRGETVTGVTTMLTDRGVDTGDILLQEKTGIGPEETAGELTGRLALLGASLLVRTLSCLPGGGCPRRPQNEEEMSYFPMLRRETGQVDWRQGAGQIADLARGLNPWPAAYSASPWGTLKILSAQALPDGSRASPGDVLAADQRDGLVVRAGDGAVRLRLLQAPGGRAMPDTDFLRGHPAPVGARMGMEGEDA